MSRKSIPVEEAFQEGRKDPEYVAAFDALEDKFAVASALIKAGGDAEIVQERREVLGLGDLTEADIAALEATRAPEASRAFDNELTAFGDTEMDASHNHLDVEQHCDPATPPQRTPVDAAARMREQRKGNILPDDITIRDLMTNGRA